VRKYLWGIFCASFAISASAPVAIAFDDDPEQEASLVEARFRWFFQLRDYPGNAFDRGGRRKALVQRKRPVVAAPVACTWYSLGPRNINGRIRAMASHPNDGLTYYAGSANGGVWVTRNAGRWWSPLMHDEPALEIGALAVHLTDPGNPSGEVTIYAGTGESHCLPWYDGVGVLKSTDSGKTWSATGAMPGPGNDRAAGILIDPSSISVNPATTVVYAAGTAMQCSTGGVFKSTNGGATWSLLLAKPISDLAMDPVNTQVLYAGVQGEGISRFDPVSGAWTALNTGLPTTMPKLIAVRIGKSAPHKIYAKLDQTVYEYNASAATWVSRGSHGGPTYGDWSNVLEVDPTDSNIVFAGGTNLERTADGGATWIKVPPSAEVHVDQHALTFNPTDHLNVFVGNDGGVYRGLFSSMQPSGLWTKRSNGLVTTQFYHVGVAAVGNQVIGGGTQDQGTVRTVGGLTWDSIRSTDGGYFLIDPSDPYTLYAENPNGGILKSTDGGAHWGAANSGFPGGPFVTPIALDKGSSAGHRVLFAGGDDRVYRSNNGAANWVASSPDVGSGVLAIAIAPSDRNVVYAATRHGRIWRSGNNGTSMSGWQDITVGTVAGGVTLPNRSITSIAVYPTDPNQVVVGFSGYATATPGTPGHVFHGTSTDGGASWQWLDVSSDLPDIPVNSVCIQPTDTNTIYAATDIGVFRTINGGGSWLDFGENLPNVVVAYLAINETGTLLRAATHGFGMFARRLDTSCQPADIYVRDNKLDTGETVPSPAGLQDPTTPGSAIGTFESADLKMDASPLSSTMDDGVEFDLFRSEPALSSASAPGPNRVALQIHNRGPAPASNVKAKLVWALNTTGSPPQLPTDFWTRFPDDSTVAGPWHSIDSATPFQTISQVDPAVPAIIQWDWTATLSAPASVWIMAVVTSDEDPVVRSDAIAQDRDPVFVVPNDKHIALREFDVRTYTSVTPTSGGGTGASGVCECTAPCRPRSCPISDLFTRLRHGLFSSGCSQSCRSPVENCCPHCGGSRRATTR
jgi:hypothetical protein